jgi:hypothetical protein
VVVVAFVVVVVLVLGFVVVVVLELRPPAEVLVSMAGVHSSRQERTAHA